MNPSDELIYKLLLEQYHSFINRQTMTRLINRSLLVIGNIVLSLFSFSVYKDRIFMVYAATVLFVMLLILAIIWKFEDSNLKILIEQIEKVVFRDNERFSNFAADSYIKALYKKYYPERKYKYPVAISIGLIGTGLLELNVKSIFSEQFFWSLVVIINYCLLLTITLPQK